MSYTVLIVDDHAAWRSHLRSELQKQSRWRVVGEAADGGEAVLHARALAPDLILLDIGLPTMNGIEAARRIVAHDSSARILFVTEQRSPDVAEAALATGARGYMVKTDAAAKLLHAMDTVLNGGRFVSAALAAHQPRPSEPSATQARCHEVGFYSDERMLVEDYARFAGAALGAGHACVVLGWNGRGDALRNALKERGVAIDRAIADGRFVSMDPQLLLSRFMVDGWPDEARLRSEATTLLTPLFAAANGERRRVALCGELAPSLWKSGNAEAAIRLEQLWDELCSTRGLNTLCGYATAVPDVRDDRYRVFQRICAAHSDIHIH